MDKPQGRLAAIFAIFAFIACNGLVILVAVLSFIGVSVSINPHIQAAAISIISMVTLVLVYRGFKQNRKIAPLILATLATVTLIGTMYIHFNKIVESLGLIALFAAALWSWQINRTQCARKSV
jgi:phosphoglycerol transferase MdoB-like AlkP superfamily enzyme